MAWPSSTKAPTTNVDAGSDKPALARPDIKQNIDNVNAIIDTFDIAAPSNGDILVYNSTSGAWEPGAAAGGGAELGTFTMVAGEELVSGNTYRRTITVESDTFDFMTQNGNYQITFAPGTYVFEPVISTENDTEVSISLFNESTSTGLATFSFSEIGTTGTALLFGFKLETFASNTNISLRQVTADAGNRNTNCRIKVTKI
jgi:hypothetical protein